MKKIVLFLAIALFFAACNQDSNKVKVVKNYDIEYLTDREVDQAAGTEEQIDSAVADIKYTVGEAVKTDSLPVRANVSFRLYINKTGSIDAVKMLKPAKDGFSDNKYKYIDTDELIDEIASVASNWEFTPAMRKGEPVNYQKDMQALVTINTDGGMSVDLPSVSRVSKTSHTNFFKSEEYFIAVEKQPYPIGGLDSIQAKIKYPELAKRAGVEGKVFVKAYIDEKGNVVDAGIIKGIGAGCDEAALEAVLQTKFSPGMQRNKPVRVQVSIPIMFKLQ